MASRSPPSSQIPVPQPSAAALLGHHGAFAQVSPRTGQLPGEWASRDLAPFSFPSPEWSSCVTRLWYSRAGPPLGHPEVVPTAPSTSQALIAAYAAHGKVCPPARCCVRSGPKAPHSPDSCSTCSGNTVADFSWPHPSGSRCWLDWRWGQTCCSHPAWVLSRLDPIHAVPSWGLWECPAHV